MAIPTFQAWGTGGAGTGTVTPGLPSGWQVGDIFLLFAETAAYHITTIPTGWTFLPYDYLTYGEPGWDQATELTVWWKRAVSGDGAPTVSHSGDHVVARICNIRGCATNGSPVNAQAADLGWGGDTVRLTGVTTTKNDCLVVAAICAGTDTTSSQYSSWTAAGLSDFTERADYFVSYGNGGGWGVAMGGKAAKGSTGDIMVDVGKESRNPYIVFALSPVDTNMAGGMDVRGRVTRQFAGGEESHIKASGLGITGGISGMSINRVGVTTQDLHQTSAGALSMSGEVSYSLGSVAILLQWSDDAGETWNTGQTISVGGSQKRAVWNRLGNSRDRIYRTTVTTPCKVVIIGASLEAVKAGL